MSRSRRLLASNFLMTLCSHNMGHTGCNVIGGYLWDEFLGLTTTRQVLKEEGKRTNTSGFMGNLVTLE